MVQEVDADPEESKKSLSYCFELEEQPPVYRDRPGVYTRDSFRGDVVDSSVLEISIHFQRKALTLNHSLKISAYYLESRTLSQVLGWANVMNSILRLPKEECQTATKALLEL